MRLTSKRLNRIILEEVEKIKQEKDNYDPIKQLIATGEKIEIRINSSLQHLKAFISLGSKVKDPFEFKRATAEISRIITLATDYQKIITAVHENAERVEQLEKQQQFQQENPGKQMQQEGGKGSGIEGHKTEDDEMNAHSIGVNLERQKEKLQQRLKEPIAVPEKRKILLQIKQIDDRIKTYLNESLNTYGVILEYDNKRYNKEITASTESIAIKKIEKLYPLYEIKKVVLLKEDTLEPNAIWNQRKGDIKAYINRINIDDEEIYQIKIYDKYSKLLKSSKEKTLQLAKKEIFNFFNKNENDDVGTGLIMSKEKSELSEAGDYENFRPADNYNKVKHNKFMLQGYKDFLAKKTSKEFPKNYSQQAIKLWQQGWEFGQNEAADNYKGY